MKARKAHLQITLHILLTFRQSNYFLLFIHLFRFWQEGRIDKFVWNYMGCIERNSCLSFHLINRYENMKLVIYLLRIRKLIICRNYLWFMKHVNNFYYILFSFITKFKGKARQKSSVFSSRNIHYLYLSHLYIDQYFFRLWLPNCFYKL